MSSHVARSVVGIEMMAGEECDAIVAAVVQDIPTASVVQIPGMVLLDVPDRMVIHAATVSDYLGRDWDSRDLNQVVSAYRGYFTRWDATRSCCPGTLTIPETMSVYDDLSSEERIIHVCVNVDCAMRGSEQLRDRLRAAAEEAASDVEVNDYICFAACEQGPNLLIEHQRAFYSDVDPSHAEAIIAHADGGTAVESIDAVTLSSPAKKSSTCSTRDSNRAT